MTFIGQNLTEWSWKLREYVNDDRPLNLAEMRSLLDIIESVRNPAIEITKSVPEKSVPVWMLNQWRNLKNQLGRV